MSLLKKLALTAIVFGLSGCNKDYNSADSSTTKTQVQHKIKTICGKIVDIDENSFAVQGNRSATNFEFEHFRIKTSDNRIYKIIFPGPSNYIVGDEIELTYKEQQKVFFEDLVENSNKKLDFMFGITQLQFGYFDVDGIALR